MKELAGSVSTHTRVEVADQVGRDLPMVIEITDFVSYVCLKFLKRFFFLGLSQRNPCFACKLSLRRFASYLHYIIKATCWLKGGNMSVVFALYN